jgi:hypothetical protein
MSVSLDELRLTEYEEGIEDIGFSALANFWRN